MKPAEGSLILVATPIGNLGDISERAVHTLRTAHAIACEDTRHTRKLLSHNGISGSTLIAVHEHNEQERASNIVERVQNGDTVALVTDAGMPAISDPGERVVAAVAAAGLRVSVVPGPSAMPAALAISGLPTTRFCFEGFLPRKGSQRRHRLEALAHEQRTSVLYESPHRALETVTDLSEVCGSDRRVVLVRELTKIHEEVWRGTLSGLQERLQTAIKGECVLVLEGALIEAVEVTDEDIRVALHAALQEGVSRRDAIAEAAEMLGVPKNRVYAIANNREG